MGGLPGQRQELRRRGGWGLLLGLALVACAPGPPAAVTVSDGRYAMGTILEVTLVVANPAQGRRIADRLYAEVAALEAELTVFDPNSALSRFNRTAGSGAVPVPPALAQVLADSLAYSRLTGGSFDVTVGPLVELWIAAGRSGREPDAAALRDARRRVGADKLAVSGADRASLAVPGMAVNLGGVAKGFALDRLAESLDEEGVADAFLSFGQSSLHTRGAPAAGGRWQLLLGGPDERPAGLLRLGTSAVSVSGSLGQWSEIGGRRYGHVIDPRSGRPLERAYLAAVVAPTAAEAEAWSKALLVLGEPGIALLEARRGAEGLLVDENGGLAATSGFDEAAGFEALAP